MKHRSPRLPRTQRHFIATLVALPALSLVTGCGSADDPAPFDATDPLSARLERDLGAPVVLDLTPRHPYVTTTTRARVLATGQQRGEAVRTWLAPYANDLGLGAGDLEVGAEGMDGSGISHVQVRERGDFGSIRRTDGLDVMTDAEGHFLALSGHLMPSKVRVPPNVGAEAAMEAARLALSSDLGANSTTLEVYSTDGNTSSDEARLAYRVELPGNAVWVDATTQAILATEPKDADLLATSVESTMFDESLLFYKHGMMKEVDTTRVEGGYVLSGPRTGSRIEVTSLVGFRDRIPLVSASLTSQDPTRWDEQTPAYQGSYVQNGRRIPFPISATGTAPHVAVDAVHNVALADAFFRRHLFRGPARGDTIRIAVHANFRAGGTDEMGEQGQNGRDSASFNLDTNTFFFGDGSYFYNESNRTQPSSRVAPMVLSLDVVGHELTHGFVERQIGLTGEAGAINEGIADAVGTIFEREADPSARAGWLADRSLGDTCYRNLAHPERGCRFQPKPTASHLASRECVVTSAGKSKYATPSAANDYGCVHHNATIVGHAFYLMSFGGYNPTSRVVVEAPVSAAVSRGLTLGYVALAGNSALAAVTPRTFLDLARYQVDLARLTSPSDANTVACAWHAVGVLDGPYMANMGFSCRTLPNESCAGKPNGWYCGEALSFNAYLCEKGSYKDGNQCASGYVCAIADDLSHRAILQPNGRPRCDSRFLP